MGKFLKVLKNYYIVFSVCVLCVFVTALLFGMKYYNQTQVKKTALAPPPIYLDDSSNVSKNEAEIKKKDNIITKQSKTSDKKIMEKSNNESVQTMAILKKEEFKIIMPVSGDVIKEYSKDNLVYSNTFEDYRTHKGVDISSKRSEAVLAVSDGVIENVYTDSLEGIVIEINHNNGFKSIYKNLSSDKMVKKGESVTKGQAISGVGETAIFEAKDIPHLHFELKNNDEYVDPEEYFE